MRLAGYLCSTPVTSRIVGLLCVCVVWLCVCGYVCVYVCTCMWICVVWICGRMDVWVWVCMCGVWVGVGWYWCVYHIYVCVDGCMCRYVSMCVYV